MTREEIEQRIAIVRTILKFLHEKLSHYETEECRLTWGLNRARRLEREELQNDTK